LLFITKNADYPAKNTPGSPRKTVPRMVASENNPYLRTKSNNRQDMYLFFDTETTGLPRNWKAPVTNVNNWPRMVQLAWLLYDASGTLLEREDQVIQPDGYTIPAEAESVHGISTRRAMEEGEDLIVVLSKFEERIQKADYLVAHNMSFDEKIAGAEFLRVGLHNPIPEKERICTMTTTTAFCGIEGPYGYKWPRLSELHQKLFGEAFEEAHNAAADIQATGRCFWELRDRGLI